MRLSAVLLTLLIGFSARSENEITIGRSSANVFKIVPDFEEPLPLPHSPFAGIVGYATDEVGFHSAFVDDPDNDLFTLSSASNLRFVLQAKQPGMEVWNDHGSAYMGVSESFFIGPPFFDTHPIWNIVSGTPGSSYALTLVTHPKRLLGASSGFIGRCCRKKKKCAEKV